MLFCDERKCVALEPRNTMYKPTTINYAALMSSDVIGLFRGIIFFTIFEDLVTAAIIPMPWKVFLPSRVHKLWSALSATNWANDSGDTQSTSVLLAIAAFFSKSVTSWYDEQNPSACNKSIKKRDKKDGVVQFLGPTATVLITNKGVMLR